MHGNQTGYKQVTRPYLFLLKITNQQRCYAYLTLPRLILFQVLHTQKKSVEIHHFPLRSKPLDEWDYIMDVVVQNEIQNKMVSTNM